MSRYPALFSPLTLKHLRIRNRLLSTSHAPGYAVGGRITERYLRYQQEKARGGVGLTQFGGATAVSIENSFHYGQINGAHEEVVPEYRAMAARIHEHGAACTVQLTHGGRRELGGIAHWLAERIDRLGVDIRLNAVAEADDVTAEGPDVVIVATGGLPNVGFFDGTEHVTTVWDVLGGHAEAGGRVLVCDENGSHHGPSCAEHLASHGARVEIATPDRALCNEMAETNQGAHLNELYRHGVRIRPDTRLLGVRREGNHLVAILANMFTGEREQLEVDQVIGDYGTLPNDSLYFELKSGSTNLGEVDLQTMADARPQDLCTNPDGAYRLFRVGDAWTSRNIHAAMLDSLRLCKDL